MSGNRVGLVLHRAFSFAITLIGGLVYKSTMIQGIFVKLGTS